MPITITYTDTSTNTLLREVVISDEEIKALRSDMVDIVEWHENAIRAKASRMVDSVVGQALKPGSDMLSEADKAIIRDKLIETGQFISRVQDIPDDIKREIVKRAKVPEASPIPPKA